MKLEATLEKRGGGASEADTDDLDLGRLGVHREAGCTGVRIVFMHRRRGARSSDIAYIRSAATASRAIPQRVFQLGWKRKSQSRRQV